MEYLSLGIANLKFFKEKIYIVLTSQINSFASQIGNTPLFKPNSYSTLS